MNDRNLNGFLKSRAEDDHLEGSESLAFPAKARKPKLSAERKQKKKLFDQHQGREDAKMWAENVHPMTIIEFLKAVGEYGPPRSKIWNALGQPFVALSEQLEFWGNDYSKAFVHFVQSHWHINRMPWCNVLYTEGLADGRRWADEFAHVEEICRLRIAIDERSLQGPWHENTFSEQLEFRTPAHKLVVWALGEQYPRSSPADDDHLGDIVFDCQEFKRFWQPFFAEPMDEVVKDLRRIGGISKLNSEIYIAGFVDGVFTFSKCLKIKYSPGSM